MVKSGSAACFLFEGNGSGDGENRSFYSCSSLWLSAAWYGHGSMFEGETKTVGQGSMMVGMKRGP